MKKMSKPWFAALLASILCFPAAALAADMLGWSHFEPLETQGGSKYKAVFLTDEVYAHALPNLFDLRIVDKAGKQVPYYIQAGNVSREQNETLIATRAIGSYKKDEDGYFDYAVVVQPGVDPTANKIVFGALPAGNFVRQIEMYGSYDNVKWQYVVKGQIYRVDGRIRNELPLEGIRKFAYYRVKVLDNIGDLAPGEMKLVFAENRAEWSRYERSFVPAFETKDEQRETVITLHNPNKLRIKRIVFDIADNFQRTYNLFEQGKTASFLQSGEIYNLKFSGVDISSKGITLKKQLLDDTIVVKINNRDDRPLQIKGVSAEYYVDKLVFQDLGEGPYRLYFGNAKAEKMAYELALQQNYIEKEAQDICVLQAGQENKGTTSFWPAIQESYLLNGAVAIVSLVLIYILISKLSLRQ